LQNKHKRCGIMVPKKTRITMSAVGTKLLRFVKGEMSLLRSFCFLFPSCLPECRSYGAGFLQNKHQRCSIMVPQKTRITISAEGTRLLRYVKIKLLRCKLQIFFIKNYS
jgi:hypothetical protein